MINRFSTLNTRPNQHEYYVTTSKTSRLSQGYNDKPLEPLQQDKVCWENKLLGGWTVQQWRSNIDDCTPTSVELNICPGDDSGNPHAATRKIQT